jgi:hypothetical protein
MTGDEALREAWNLYLQMTEDLAVANGEAAYAQETVEDGWDDFPPRISTVEEALYQLAGPSDTFSERRHNRGERNEIAGVNETLYETHSFLVDVANAQTHYLQVEAVIKGELAEGETPEDMAAGRSLDMSDLDMAREQIARSRQSLAESRANLALRIEDLAGPAFWDAGT